MTTQNLTSVEDVEINRFHKLLTIRSGGGWVMDGYILSIIGVVLGEMSQKLSLSNTEEGLIAASSLIGIFFGGFLGGWLTDKLGRQKLYIAAPLIFLICSLAQGWATSGTEIFIYRFFIGIGVGIEYPVAGSLLTEFLPKRYRGPRLAFLTVLWFAGAALAYIVGMSLLNSGLADAWRYIIATPAVIGLFLIIIRLGTPESPRWLISKGRPAEAEAIIKKVYGNSFSLKNLPEEPAEHKVTILDLLKSGYGTRMMFVAVFWSCSVIPVFAVYSFAPKVLSALKLTGSWETYGSIAITLMFVVGCVIATKVINTLGRRTMVIHSFLWSGLALIGLGLFSDANGLLILVLFGLYALFIGGAQVLQLVYPNELFPTDIRAFAVGMGASLSRVDAAIATWLVPIVLNGYGISFTMYGAAAVSFVGLAASIMFAPETKSLSLHEAASLKRTDKNLYGSKA